MTHKLLSILSTPSEIFVTTQIHLFLYCRKFIKNFSQCSATTHSKTREEAADEKSVRLEIGYLRNEVIVQCGYIDNLISESNSDTDISASISLSIDRDTHNGISWINTHPFHFHRKRGGGRAMRVVESISQILINSIVNETLFFLAYSQHVAIWIHILHSSYACGVDMESNRNKRRRKESLSNESLSIWSFEWMERIESHKLRVYLFCFIEFKSV